MDTYEPEPEIGIKATQARIEELDGKLAAVCEKMDGYLKELDVV